MKRYEWNNITNYHWLGSKLSRERNPYLEEAYFYHRIYGSLYGMADHVQVTVMLAQVCNLNVLSSIVSYFLHIPRTKQAFSNCVNEEIFNKITHLITRGAQKISWNCVKGMTGKPNGNPVKDFDRNSQLIKLVS